MPRKSLVGQLASAATKKEFADQLSNYTSLTAAEVKTLFPKKSDRNELLELVRIVHSSSDENLQKEKLISNINQVGGAVLKITKRVVLV